MADGPALAVERCPVNPAIHPRLCDSIGTNINGPSVIRVPDWVEDPLGRYYMYFADHRGSFIRLAYAHDPAGPWHIHRPGALHLADAGFPTEASHLDPPERLRKSVASGNLRPHIASPDVHVDGCAKRIVMYYHGLERDCTQTSRVAVSGDGLRFGRSRPASSEPYLRVFVLGGGHFGVTLAGKLVASPDGGISFGDPRPFGPPEIRHMAIFDHAGTRHLVFSRIGDAPERLLISRIDARGNWRGWRLAEPSELLRAEADWEGGDLPVEPSRMGASDAPANQLRDPCVLSDGGRLWLYYACAGEAGIAVARLVFAKNRNS